VEEALLTGALEPTNEWYAIAKIAGIKLCQAYRLEHGRDYISAMPTNLYGIGDNFDLNTSHVLPALIRKAHDAKIGRRSSFNIWGTGNALREFLFADDCADACIHLLQHYSGESPINIGSGSEVTILELAKIVAEVVGYDGTIDRDESKPDGTPRKLMNSGRLNELGWRPATNLRDGIAQTYEWYLTSIEQCLE
jgi:GDP-L-fucose synthase